jgi:hypothetical protein
MPSRSEPAERPVRARFVAIRAFFEAAVGLIVIFALAAMLAPALFNRHNDLALLGAVAIWLVCPVLLFLLVLRVVGRLRGPNSGPIR